MRQSALPSDTARMPPSTRPPGQPACSALSQRVLSRLNMVVTTGLITASTVPLPSATMKVPTYRLQ